MQRMYTLKLVYFLLLVFASSISYGTNSKCLVSLNDASKHISELSSSILNHSLARTSGMEFEGSCLKSMGIDGVASKVKTYFESLGYSVKKENYIIQKDKFEFDYVDIILDGKQKITISEENYSGQLSSDRMSVEIASKILNTKHDVNEWEIFLDSLLKDKTIKDEPLFGGIHVHVHPGKLDKSYRSKLESFLKKIEVDLYNQFKAVNTRSIADVIRFSEKYGTYELRIFNSSNSMKYRDDAFNFSFKLFNNIFDNNSELFHLILKDKNVSFERVLDLINYKSSMSTIERESLLGYFEKLQVDNHSLMIFPYVYKSFSDYTDAFLEKSINLKKDSDITIQFLLSNLILLSGEDAFQKFPKWDVKKSADMLGFVILKKLSLDKRIEFFNILLDSYKVHEVDEIFETYLIALKNIYHLVPNDQKESFINKVIKNTSEIYQFKITNYLK